MPTAVVTPVYGWGFLETIDGELAPSFAVDIAEAGVDIGQLGPGWRGSAVQFGHKYHGFSVTMLPRHVNWTETVFLWVQYGDRVVFDGLAETKGLDCAWKIDGITNSK